MQGDESQSKTPLGVQSDVQDTSSINPPAVKREAEVASAGNVQGEVIHDSEVLDAGVKETPSPELSPHVEIAEPESPLPATPQTAVSVPQSVASEVQEGVVGIPTLDDATKILKESGQVIPFKTQTSRVYRASVVVREKLPKAA